VPEEMKEYLMLYGGRVGMEKVAGKVWEDLDGSS
jgi:hypothetical protein